MNKIPFFWWSNTYVVSKGLQSGQYIAIICKIVLLTYQKIPKVANTCSDAKGGWSLLIKRLSIKDTSVLLGSIEKYSKPDKWLQNKWCLFMAESLSPFTLFLVRA